MVEINGKNYELKRLRYLDVVELSEVSNKKEHLLKLFELSGIPKEVTEQLEIEKGKEITNEINVLNGFGDFRKPSEGN